MKRIQEDHWEFTVAIMGLTLLFAFWVCALVANAGPAKGPIPSKGVRTLRLSPNQVGKVNLAPWRITVLSFPARPSKVVLGNPAITVDYIENDLSFSVVRPFSRSNAFVYVEGRRFGFDLIQNVSSPDSVIFVRDAKD